VHKDMNQLYELQQVDTAIAELEADLKALDDGSGLRADLQAAEAELVRLQAACQDDLANQQRREAELEKTEQKRKKLMDKAYGGTIGNPKELETLEKEIEALSRQKDRIETDLLGIFDQVDGAKQAAEAQGRTVQALKQRLEETVATYEAERARLTDQVAGLREERSTRQAPLDPDLLRRYGLLRERCAGVAVVAVESGTCSGCRIGLPVVQLARLRRGRELLQCESCLRLLWIETDEDDEE